VKQDAWFGVEHHVAIGMHAFEFVPENAECCLPSPLVNRAIEEGEGPVNITLVAGFRDARFRVDRAPAGHLRCSTLFSANLEVPGELPVAMSAPAATGLCTMVPNDAQQPPMTKEVTLNAGQTTEVSWP
jgi:hypothetical protein